MAFRRVICWLWVLGSAVSTAQAERLGALEPGLAAEPVPPPGSWQTRRDYSRFPVSRAIALPALADAEAAARLAPAEPGQPFRIGMARELPDTFRGDLAKTVPWSELPGGGRVASFSVRSPDAEAVRLAVRASLPDGARVRFFEVGDPDRRYPVFKASDFIAQGGLAESEAAEPGTRMRWSPSVAGDTVGVEIEIPPFAEPGEVSFRILRASHIWGSPSALSPGRLMRKSAVACGPVEVACKSLPGCPNTAVARVVFTLEDGETYVCTGTAVRSFRSDFDNIDKPFLLTAHHCINTESAADSVVTEWALRT